VQPSYWYAFASYWAGQAVHAKRLCTSCGSPTDPIAFFIFFYRELPSHITPVKRLQSVPSRNGMVVTVQQYVIVKKHGFKRIASPSRQEVVPHNMAFRLNTGRCIGYFFRSIPRIFKGLFVIHTLKYTQKLIQHNTPLSLRHYKGVSQKKKKCILHSNRARFS